MASYRAIAATSRAIIGLLEDACPAGAFPGVRFDLLRAGALREPPFDFGLTLYLFRVAVNGTRRNLPPRVDLDGRRYRPPLPVDLSYLLSVWATDATQQQLLLGWAMRQLEDVPTLPSGLLNHYLSPAEHFHPNEGVELVSDAFSLADLANLWETVKPNIPLSVGYVARMVPIESTVELPPAGPVQTRVLEMAAGPPS